MPQASFELVTGRLTEKSAKRNVIVFAEGKGRLTAAAQVVDAQVGGHVARTLKTTRFQGNAGEFARVTLQNDAVFQVIVAGIGKQAGMERRDWWRAGLSLGRQIDAMGLKEATIALGDIAATGDAEVEAARALIEGLGMALYRFERFKDVKEHLQGRFEKLTVLTSARTAKELEDTYPRTRALIEATALTRDCANLPPNVANPQFMADEAKKLEKAGVKVQVLDESDMAKLGLNLFLAVGGSAAPADQPRLVLMHYNGGAKGEAPVAIVGKGIMFDTGGYNLKPGASMGGMKFDMSGAAAVLGTMRALAENRVPVNVVGVMACAMNMVGQTPFVPDSVYKSYKGLFVEIGNTDAEGRLVLADAMAYTIDKFAPSQIVDLATLTGSVMAALGGGYAGLFSTSNSLAAALQKAGDEVGERLWRMPVDDFYAAKTHIADVNNDGSPYGGSITAAVFLKKFADKTPWAHLDIAGVANKDKGAVGVPDVFSGATGFGVRLLVNWLESTAPAGESTGRRTRRGRPAIRAAAPRATTGTGRRGRPPKALAGTKPAKVPAAPGTRKRGRPRKVTA